jgi:hypothetical protein
MLCPISPNNPLLLIRLHVLYMYDMASRAIHVLDQLVEEKTS